MITLLASRLLSNKIRKSYRRIKTEKFAFVENSKTEGSFRQLAPSGKRKIDYFVLGDKQTLKIQNLNCSYPESGIFYFNNAQVMNSAGLIRTNKGSFLRESIEVSLMHNKRILDNTTSSKPKSNIILDATCAVLCAPCSDCYYHWMIDVLPRLELLKRNDQQIDYYIFSDLSKEFQKETLQTLGLKKEQLLAISDIPLSVRTLIYPYKPTIVDTPDHDQCYSLDPGSINFITNTFKQKNTINPFRKIFISRRLSSRRRIINQNEIDAFFVRSGFEILNLEKMTVRDQIKAFHEASIIVSTHGAGLTNLIFCQQGTKVIEIFPTDVFGYQFPKGHEVHLYARISKLLNLDYDLVLADTQVSKNASSWDANICDFFLPIKKFEKFQSLF